MTPPWTKFLPIENTSGGLTQTKLVIGIWLGTLATIPTGWQLAGSVPFDRYIRGAANSGEIGNTGGATTHTHQAGGSHTHSIDAHIHPSVNTNASNSAANTNSAAGSGARGDHTHTTGALSNNGSGTSGAQVVSGSANTSNDPVHTRVAYIQFINTPPNAPTINVPVAGTAYSSTIALDATVSDDDGDAVFAEFQYDRSDNNWVTIGNGTTVASGGRSTRNWDISGLQAGFNYRVRARTNDSGTAFNTSAYTTSVTFIIGPGFAGLFAHDNTSKYHAEVGWE